MGVGGGGAVVMFLKASRNVCLIVTNSCSLFFFPVLSGLVCPSQDWVVVWG